MKALLAIASVGAALASFSAPASADPFDHDHLRLDRNDVVHVGYWCGRDRHIDWQGACVWDHAHFEAPIVIIRPIIRY